ncbi:nuclear transport factor 2 family protein [Roseomonas sp. E05]|uniref:nuclear transport factor 2 family protein n=1 Tax=Roseomonas sp. E05 TaxID=3046310 RepID=UPI0024BBDA1E|nr:nuclear transport factor 2 family protein [Roseomonas sp. E05]MDJ0387830.1 nuclear transport factor 2 family protein [Roseomonas sp. E05]
MTATDAQTLATRYIAAWNETDPARRRALLAGLWTEDATYRDPLMQGAGHEGIAALIAGVQARFPGHRFALAGRPDGYADRLRFSWTLGPEAGAPLVAGTDFARLAEDGRLRTVCGFLDRLPGEA